MLQPIKTLFFTISDTHAYAHLANLSFSHALRYFLLLITLIGFLYATFITTVILPPLVTFTRSALEDVIDMYPTQALITLQQNQLTVAGVQEPYLLPLSQPKPPIMNLLAIDTSANAESLPKYQSLFLLTSQSMGVNLNGENNAIRIFKWSDFNQEATITATDITTEAQGTLTLLNQIEPYVLPITTILTTLYLLTTRLLFGLLHSILIRFILVITRRVYPYRLVMKIVLYTLIVTELFWGIVHLIHESPPSYLYSLAFYLITLTAFSAFKPRPRVA
jgi:hypothetical protein